MQFPSNAKVALINPGTNPELAFHEPLNIGFLAGYLEVRGYEVRIIDELAGQNVAQAIDAFAPHLVGITGTTPVIPHAYEHAAYARSKGIPVVLGGVHAGVCTAEAMQHADVVVKGEGEVALLEILQKGITAELAQNKLVQGSPIKDLDTIPFPARHLMDMDFYVRVKQRVEQTHLYFVGREDRVAGVLSSRGCPYFCAFCHNNWRETPLRCMTPERTIEELQHLKDDFGVTAVFFMDDDLFANKPRIKRLCELMIEKRLDLKWGCQARVKAKAVNEEMLRLAHRAGCRQMSFGFESGSQRILDILKGKTTTVEDNRRAVKLCNKVGMPVAGSFMIGSPTETVEDIRATQMFIRESDLIGVGLHITTPYPGTELWNWCAQEGLIPQDIDWGSWTSSKAVIRANENLTPEQLDRLRWQIVFREVIWPNKARYAYLTALGAWRKPKQTFEKVIKALGSALGGPLWSQLSRLMPGRVEYERCTPFEAGRPGGSKEAGEALAAVTAAKAAGARPDRSAELGIEEGEIRMPKWRDINSTIAASRAAGPPVSS